MSKSFKKGKEPFKRKTAEEKKEELDNLVQTLENGMKNFKHDSETFKAILQMQAIMPKYSFRNIMVARAQIPHASYIASFNRWKELSRNVIKGEKAIYIFAPRFAKVENEVSGEEETKLIGYITVPVFDISQTEGKPLPIDKIKLLLEGESEEADHIFEVAKKMAAADNCPVTIESAGSANGYYSISEHKIVVDPKLSGNHRAKTTVHELVHSRVHRKGMVEKTTAEEREIVAEGTAFVVCSYFGLDTSDYSFRYVRSWSSDGGQSLMKYGELIQKTSSKLIEEFEGISASVQSNTDCIEPDEAKIA